MGTFWELIEGELYASSLDQLTDDLLSLAPAIDIIDHGLRRNPLGYRKIDGYENLYIAKTKIILTMDYFVPALRMWFLVDETRREVTREWVEYLPVEDPDF